MMKIRYGSPESVIMARRIQNTLMNEAYEASAELAREKSQFALYDEEKYMAGDMVGRLNKDVRRKIKEHGLRNSHLLSIQPTGNTSQVAGVVSGGLEPVFSFRQQRTAEQPHLPDGLTKPVRMPEHEGETLGDSHGETIWRAEKQHREIVWRCTIDGLEDWTVHPTRGVCKDVLLEDYGVRRMKEIGEWDADAEWAVKTRDLSVQDHIRVMEPFARYTDSALSKTVNIPADYPFEDFQELYEDAWETGVIKGLTTYRAGTMSAVLEDADEEEEEDSSESVVPDECPDCGDSSFVHKEGCIECETCGWQACSI
jgi:ribonucleoside-diphosphate reductase alpha chain